MERDKVKNFWESQGSKYKNVPFESLSNFEEDPFILNRRIAIEKEIVFSKLPLKITDTVLDLGSGVGQWTFRFSPLVQSVTAVEYASSLVEIAKIEQEKKQFNNIKLIHQSADEYIGDNKFDIIFISGLLVYLNDEQIMRIVNNLKGMVKDSTLIFLREPTSILKNRYKIVDQYSKELKTNYSAEYRTASEYKEIFRKLNFKCQEDDQFFQEGSDLNKFPETRLRYYVFKNN